MTANPIGQPVPRVDGRLKVTGSADYAAEHHPDGMAHGVVVQSTIAAGWISGFDVAAAEAVPGVVRVILAGGIPDFPWEENRQIVDPAEGVIERPLAELRVLHQGQHIALVVAETLEAARHAASLVRVSYREERAVTSITEAVRQAEPVSGESSKEYPPNVERGDVEGEWARSAVTVSASYVMPRHNQNPMETHATIASWTASGLTLWDKTQWPQNVAETVGKALGLPKDQVHVICPFVGGAFGSSLRVWPHTYLAAIASKMLGRPVKIDLSRREYYGGTGCRPWTQLNMRLGADRDGRLRMIAQEAIAETSTYEDYTEAVVRPTRVLYKSEANGTYYKLAHRATNTPNAMRAPGETTGLFGLECALDELAYALRLDPVELRLRNVNDFDPFKKLPFSSTSHAECLRRGAEAFGWRRRNPQPADTREGRLLIGSGVASAIYPVNISPAEARATLMPNGEVQVLIAASDMGPGTYTSLSQVAAGTLNLPIERIRLHIGDSKLPHAPVHGGSMTMASCGHAVLAACQALLETLARDHGANTHDLARTAAGLSAPVSAEGRHDPGDLQKKYSPWAFGAVFAEVAVDPDTCETRVRRITGAYGNGHIINPRLARSQSIGGFIQGIGQALMERTEVDEQSGRIMNANLAEYLIPVLADTPALEVIFVKEDDPHLGPLQAKGIGEIALCGIGPAIANAVFHATGIRVRELPITPDKLFSGQELPAAAD